MEQKQVEEKLKTPDKVSPLKKIGEALKKGTKTVLMKGYNKEKEDNLLKGLLKGF